MTTRTYYLWTRTGTGVVNQTSGAPRSPLTCIPSAREGPPYVSSAKIDVDPCSYSDMAALRPPSPMWSKETMDSLTGLTSRAKPSCEFGKKPAVQDHSNDNLEKSSSSNDDASPKDQEGQGWTTVKRRCARSLSLLPRTKKSSIEGIHTSTLLTTEQRNTVKAAAEALSPQQKQQIQQWNLKLTTWQDFTSLTGEGQAQNKGKTIDSQEWGNIQFNIEEIDVAAQAAAFESFKPTVNKSHSMKEKTLHQWTKVREWNKNIPSLVRQNTAIPVPLVAQTVWPADSWPAAQLVPQSNLGVALQKAGASWRVKPQCCWASTDSAESNYSSDSGYMGSSPDLDESDTPSEASQSDDRHHRQHP